MASIESFIKSPSEGLLNVLSKGQLWELVEHYGIGDVDKRLKKNELKTVLKVKLSEGEILSVGNEEVIEEKESVDLFSGLSFEQKKEILKMQQMHSREMANVVKERELELKRLKMDDLLKKREIELLQLKHSQQLESEKLSRDFELQVQRLKLIGEGKMPFEGVPSQERVSRSFDVVGNLKLLPKFNERDPDVFFSLFESIAEERNWPIADRVVMLQSVITGRAQEAYMALTVEDRKDYDKVKSTILRVYELVPEAYRQRFRSWRRGERQTHVEVGRELTAHFDRWCAASNVSTFEELRDLILLEQFRNIVTDNIATYINENKPGTVAEAAVLADEFILTHRSGFADARAGGSVSYRDNLSQQRSRKFDVVPPAQRSVNSVRGKTDDNVCHYCFNNGHWKNECPVLAGKLRSRGKKINFVPTLLVDTVSTSKKLPVFSDFVMESKALKADSHLNYAPFITDGFVSLTDGIDKVPIKILRDTGSSESFILESILPFSAASSAEKNVLIRGIGLQTLSVPLHRVYLKSDLVEGEVTVGVRPSLPVKGVSVILGNNLAGGRVWRDVVPPPVVLFTPLKGQTDELSCDFPEVFVSCAVTRSVSRSLSDRVEVQKVEVPGLAGISPITRSELVAAQQNDSVLKPLFAVAVPPEEVESVATGYFVQEELLLRKWSHQSEDLGSKAIIQVVVPDQYKEVVLRAAHGDVAGHLGVKKTYHRILLQYYWPLLKKDVATFIKTCHTCQMVGKPNQVLKPVPLCPISVTSQPFEHIMIDCVGPLPPSKSGNSYLLTVMCQTTRYPAAYPLRKITTKAVVKALTHFISIFGIPRIVQSDRGTNFMSGMFAEVLRQLGVKHNQSSARHPQSQGALERFHQSLKSLLRAYCVELNRDWEDGLPWLMLAAREVTQESLGFSPNELVFGHTVRGPLTVLQDELKGEEPPKKLSDYVSGFRRRLFLAGQKAQKRLGKAQIKMKRLFDRHTECRVFSPGDQVLVLLPYPRSPFCAKFSGPYTVVRRVSEQDYIIATPDRKKLKQLCHANLLKPYFSRSSEVNISPVSVAPRVLEDSHLTGGDVKAPGNSELLPRLRNSEALENFESSLSHLSDGHRSEVMCLVAEFPRLFGDVPSRTHLIYHDVDVGDAPPIRQRFYRLPLEKRKILESEVQYMLDNGIAQHSFSGWASPCLLVKKSDGTHRFCTDYRKLNKITKPDAFPLPRMEDCVDQVGASKFVSKLDLLKGYWQVPLTTRAQEVTAFITPSGLYSYSVMSFGLRNAPATFQRLMNRVTLGLKGCAVYLDDVIIFSDTWKQHLQHLRALFDRLVEAGLTVNLSKCEFAQATVKYLGKEVGQGQVRPLQAKILAVEGFPPPSTKKELMRFLGLVGYYRSFCPNFSTVVSPLTDMLKGSMKFEWTLNCQRAFDNVKLLLTTAPVLAAPKFGQPFKIQVDASHVGAGAVLLQSDQDGVDHPVCFFSRKFNVHQRNYSVIEKEALAMIWALQHFDVYVGGGAEVLVYSDHNPLTFLHSLQSPSQRLMRWVLFLQPYNLNIQHIRGVDNVMADALSRTFDADI